MPRQSIHALTSPLRAINGTPTRIEPPKNLTKAERALFHKLVLSVQPKHFAPSDAPLLSRYCKALIRNDEVDTILERQGLVGDDGKPSQWLRVQEKLDHTITSLATKLRLTPSSRMGPRDAGRTTRAREPDAYELMAWEREQREADA